MTPYVLLAAIPYLAIAGYDFWIHETDRKVPRIESLFHGCISIGVILFLGFATLGMHGPASMALGLLLIAALIDELKYHGGLDQHEKRLHNLGGVALAFCIGVWVWTI